MCRFRENSQNKKPQSRNGVLPSGGDNYDGPGVHQLCAEQGPPPTAVQVGGLDQIGVGVDPEHQPAVGIHRQTLWTDQIYTATPKQN